MSAKTDKLLTAGIIRLGRRRDQQGNPEGPVLFYGACDCGWKTDHLPRDEAQLTTYAHQREHRGR